jgi:hypothetical protein
MRKVFALLLIVLTISSTNLFAKSGKELAVQLGLDASSKASRQWERVFKKERKMKKYGIDALSGNDKKALKDYLISHAADSDHPEAAGM